MQIWERGHLNHRREEQKKKMKYTSKHERLTEAPVEPLICRLAVPTIVTMMISSIYNLADTYFAGIIGKRRQRQSV